MNNELLLWTGFNIFVLLMLALDLGVFHRKAHVVSVKEAVVWSAVWISLALLFNAGIYYYMGQTRALEFLTGYMIEKALSVDNIFVFVLIFSYFGIPPVYQHKVLFWGVIGALVMRAVFILAGIALLEKFHWTIYIFGSILVYTGFKMFTQKDREIHPENNPVIRIFKKLFPVTSEISSPAFIVKINGIKHATPLLLVLILVETTDLIFAVDSIPAILAITQDRFIVYTSNIFAILGLRSLYFALAGIIDRFIYLAHGLALILIIVGIKMLLSDIWKVPVHYSLALIAVILAVSIILSLWSGKNNKN